MPERLTIPLRPKTSGGKVDRRYASRTEDMLELEFTDEFLDFLDRHNGGVPVTPNFKLGRNVKVVERFLSLVKDYKTNPLGQVDIGVVWSQIEDRLDEFLMPFAAVFPGDFLCFDFSKSDEPTVVLWVHDQSEEDAPHTCREELPRVPRPVVRRLGEGPKAGSTTRLKRGSGHDMQFAHLRACGSAESRRASMASPQRSQRPHVPRESRSRAASTSCSSVRSKSDRRTSTFVIS